MAIGVPFGDNLRDLALSYTGLSADDLRAALQSGSTVAELIQANGKNVDDFVSEASAQVEEQLAADVTSGRITQAQSDEITAQNGISRSSLVTGPSSEGDRSAESLSLFNRKQVPKVAQP